MHEPVLVGDIESLGDLREQGERPGRLERLLGVENSAEIGALHVAHGDVQDAVDLAAVVDGQHVGVIDRGGQLGLA